MAIKDQDGKWECDYLLPTVWVECMGGPWGASLRRDDAGNVILSRIPADEFGVRPDEFVVLTHDEDPKNFGSNVRAVLPKREINLFPLGAE